MVTIKIYLATVCKRVAPGRTNRGDTFAALPSYGQSDQKPNLQRMRFTPRASGQITYVFDSSLKPKVT